MADSKKVLVTGGAGYIGSHTCKALAAAGYQPVVYDNLSVGHEWAVKWGPLEIGDIADTARLQAVMAEYQPSAVIHFAASAYVGESVREPTKYYRNNVSGTLSLLEAMRSSDLSRIVFSSTCAVYGLPDELPIVESSARQPINPYGTSKLTVEHMLSDFDRAYELRSATLRYFNAAGADPENEIGELHEPETHLIPLVLMAALGENACVRVLGSDYPTPDGTAIRDFIHVSDLADAHVAAVGRLLDGAPSFAVNLGSNQGHSVNQIIRAVERAVGTQVTVETAPRREGDPPILVADASLAAELLGWKAHRSDLDTIIQTAWAWQRQLSQSPERRAGAGSSGAKTSA